MIFIDIAAADELAEGQMKRFEAGGQRLLLCRSNGEHFVIGEMCGHEDYSLFLGCVRDGRIKCSLHGSWFDLKSGAALDEPAHAPIRVYPVKTADGRLLAGV